MKKSGLLISPRPGTRTTPSQKTSWSEPPLCGTAKASYFSREPRKARTGLENGCGVPASSAARAPLLPRTSDSRIDSATSLR